MKESDLIKLIRYSISCCFSKSLFRKTHPDIYEEPGIPDLVGHISGIHIEIEAKVAPNYPSGIQKTQLGLINKTGGIGIMIIWKEGITYLILPGAIGDFSYKNKLGWIPLQEIKSPTGPFLKLLPLLMLVTEKLSKEVKR